MQKTYVVTGTLTDGYTLRLDEVMAKIREWQRLRGHQPPTRKAVDAYICSEREGWNE